LARLSPPLARSRQVHVAERTGHLVKVSFSTMRGKNALQWFSCPPTRARFDATFTLQRVIHVAGL
jgi:hypothetical protein